MSLDNLLASANLPWVIIGLVVLAVVVWIIWRRFSSRRESHDPLQGEFPFATIAQQQHPGVNPVPALQDRINQLEDILRQVDKKLNDRHRELEQTVTSMEAAMASMEKPFKAVAERCAYGSRLLNAQHNSQQPQPAALPPSPPQPPPMAPTAMGNHAGSGTPTAGYDSPPPGGTTCE